MLAEVITCNELLRKYAWSVRDKKVQANNCRQKHWNKQIEALGWNWSAIKRQTDSTASTTSGQKDSTSEQTNGQASTTDKIFKNTLLTEKTQPVFPLNFYKCTNYSPKLSGF